MQTNRFFSLARRWATRVALVLLLLLMSASLVSAAHTWNLKTPSPKPSARYGHAMADIGGDQALLFGGRDAGGRDDETWVYDLSDNTWTNKNPTTKPSARSGHAIAYSGGAQVVLFGGSDAGGRNAETWVYDLSANTWTNTNPDAPKPWARNLHAMAYIGDDQVLLFGGDTFGGPYDDTWVYDLSANTWTNKNPANPKPSERRSHAMAYLGGDQVLLFGGYDSDTLWYSDETWVYDLSANTWTLASPTTYPSARQDHAMARVGGDQALLFGGWDGGWWNDETWVYDLDADTWTQKSPTTSPSARDGHAMAYLGNEWVILFGGLYDSNTNDETWIAGGMSSWRIYLPAVMR